MNKNTIIIKDVRNRKVYHIPLVKNRLLAIDIHFNFFRDTYKFSLKSAHRGSKSNLYSTYRIKTDLPNDVLDYIYTKYESVNNNHNSFKHSNLYLKNNTQYSKGTDVYKSGLLRKLNSIAYFKVIIR